MKTALVTGSAGFIGSALCKTLREGGWGIVGIDMKAGPFYGDLCRISAKDLGLPKVDAVFHLAALPGISFSVENPELTYYNNVAATMSALSLAKETGASRFVFASSSSVYGNGEGAGGRANAEGDAPSPLNAYAASKVECERAVRDFSTFTGMESVILRPFSVYGPEMNPCMAMSKVADSIQGGPAFRMRGDGLARRDYVYVDDVAAAFARAAETPISGASSMTFNAGSGVPISLRGMIGAVEAAMGASAEVDVVDEERFDAVDSWADTTLSTKVLGWVPSVGFEEGVRRFAEWRAGRSAK